MTTTHGVTTNRTTPTGNRSARRLLLCAVAALLLLLSACSDSDPADIQTNAEDSADTTADGGDDDDGATDDETSSTTEDDNADGADNSDDSEDDDSDDFEEDLPGEAWDGFASDGDVFGVVGVAHDDVLNVRERPDAGSSIITTLEPTATGIEATGEGRLLPSSIWYQVDTDDGVGWVNARFVAFVGGTFDITAGYIDTGSATSAETMVDLADAIADSLIVDDEVGTTVTQTVAPTVGDLGEITYDIIGLGDDSVGGLRIHVFAVPSDGGEGFDLKSIEQTVLCSRGTDGELCV